MLIDKKFNPWLCCSTDATRLSIMDCYLDTVKSLLISTDGRALTQIPVELEPGDLAGIVPVDALKAAVKAAPRALPNARLDLTDAKAAKLADGRSWPRPQVTYPDWERVIPDFAGAGPVTRVMFSASYLKDIADAVGAKDTAGILLEFQNPEKAMRVTVNGTVHVLMPMKLDRPTRKASDVPAAPHEHRFIRVIGQEWLCDCGEKTSSAPMV